MNVFEFSKKIIYFPIFKFKLQFCILFATSVQIQFKFRKIILNSVLNGPCFPALTIVCIFAKAFVLVTLLTLITVLHSYHIVLQGCVNDFHYWCYKTIRECWSHSCPLVVLQPSDIALVSHKLYTQCVLWLMSVILADRWAVQNGREAPVNSLSEHQQWRTLSD